MNRSLRRTSLTMYSSSSKIAIGNGPSPELISYSPGQATRQHYTNSDVYFPRLREYCPSAEDKLIFMGGPDDTPLTKSRGWSWLWEAVCLGHEQAINQSINQFITHTERKTLLLLAVTRYSNKKALLSQRRPRDAPNIWVPWKVSRVLANAPGYFSRNL